MTLWDGVFLSFFIFISLCLLLIWWSIRAGQKALERHIEMDEQAWQEAIRRLPP